MRYGGVVSITKYDHDRLHREKDGDGCLGALVVLVLFVACVIMAGVMFRWTSIEHGCVVERRFTWQLDTHVVERICPEAKLPPR